MGTLYFSWSVATFRAFFALFVSSHYNHHLAGRAKQQTRPAAAVFGRPGEFDAHSRWIRKLARSSGRSTPREGAKRKKTRRPLVGGDRSHTTRKRQASKNDARHPKQRAHLLDTCKSTIFPPEAVHDVMIIPARHHRPRPRRRK